MNILDKFHFKDKNGIVTTMEICDSFSRSEINELNSKLNLKQNITDNTLSTTNKNIVGAINEINSDLSVSGTVINGVNSSGSAVVTRSAYQKMNITLPKGTYVIVGRLIFNDASDNTGWRKICLSTSPSDDTSQVTINAVNNGASGLQVSAIFSLNAETTIYMNAQHSSTSNSELGIIIRSLTAVRLK